MRCKFMAVALLVLALGFSGCDTAPDFSAFNQFAGIFDIKIPALPQAPLAEKAEMPIDPVLLGTWTIGAKREPAEADLLGNTPGFTFSAKNANEYLITIRGQRAVQPETAFLVQVGAHKILQYKEREAKSPQWHFFWFKKLTQDETVLGLPYRSGDLVGGLIYLSTVPPDKPVSDTYRDWIAKCDFSKARPGEHVLAMPLIFWPVKEQEHAKPEADKK